MPWRPLPRIAFAVAIYPFQPSSPADLPLELGDELYIIEEGGLDGSWYRGYLVAPPSLLSGLTSVKGATLEARVFSGIFPRSCVQIRELLGESETEVPRESQDGGTRSIESSVGESPGQTLVHEEEVETGIDGEQSNNRLLSKSSLANAKEINSLPNGLEDKPLLKSSASRRSIGPAFPVPPASTRVSQSHAGSRPPAPVPMLKIGDETPTSASEPLVDEIASCLREWHSSNLHELLLSRRYGELDELSRLVNQLDLSRRQLLHGVLTKQELELLRERTVWDLVTGNKMLADEVIVRDPKQRGRLLTGDDNVFEVSKLQSTMSLLEKPPTQAEDSVKLHHLLFELKSIANYAKDTPVLLVYLCVKKANEPLRPLTEPFSIEIPVRDPLSKVPNHRLRTLFTDLTATDTGEAFGSDTQLYIVLKAQVNRQAKQTPPTPPKTATIKDSVSSRESLSNHLNSTGSSGGRRSLMWAQNKLAGSQRLRSQAPSTIDESRASTDASQDGRPVSPPAQRAANSQPGSQSVKKDIGVSVVQLKGFFNEERDTEQSMTLWTPSDSIQEVREGEDGWEELIQSVTASPSGQYSKSRLLNRVKFKVHSFVHPDADTLVRMTPTLLHNVHKTPKIGFSGAPTKPRSDIYITLTQPNITGQALFSHPEKGAVPLGTNLDMQSLQLTFEVRRPSGERIEKCIFPASNSPGSTAWRTTAIPKGGSWSQTIKLVIDSEDVPSAHLVMSLADFPGFPFALCWMPLWENGAFIQDGSHVPLLHAYDRITSHSENGRGAYLDLPWNSKGKDAAERESWSGHLATLKMETYLCSTTFSQDQVLLSILKWRDQSDNQLLALLRQVVFVPEIEIVKLVSDVFDALFAILVDRSGNDEYEDLVFNALVTVLGIVHDRRFNLGPLVDEYANVRFNYPFATPGLVRSYLRLITKPSDYQNARQLRATFKVGKQLMKFILIARTQQKIKEASIGIVNTGPNFVRDVAKIFQALEDQMRDQSAYLIGSKTLIVQHMHTWCPELKLCFSQEEIMNIVIGFVDSCADVQGKLILHKLVMILNLAKASRSIEDNLQRIFEQKVEEWISPYWGLTDEPNEQYRDQVRLCCSILALREGDYGPQVARFYFKILQSYHCLLTMERSSTRTLSLLFPSSYPFPTKPTAAQRNYDEALIELAALRATFKPKDLIAHYGEFDDLASCLSMTLEVNMSILQGGAFPESWLTLHVYHHRMIFGFLDGITKVMTREFLPAPEDADNFNTDLWRTLLTALLGLVRSEALALETLPEQKRRAVWKIVGDIREQGAELLNRVWDTLGWETDAEEKRQYGLTRLGGFQVQYVPSLVGPIVELCLSVHDGLRRTAVEILQSMIISEWALNEDLAVVQAEMVYSLDNLFRTRNVGEHAQQRLFIAQLIELFEPLSSSPDMQLWEATKSLVSTIDELLDLLVAVHAPDQNETYRITNTLRLMEFLRDMQKEDIYVNYVHKLAGVEAQAKNSREAGLAIGLHANLYAWDLTETVDELKVPSLPKQTAFERKESLYFDMIRHFEEGAAWECALSCYRELAEQYEHKTFDFAKLARTQRSTARIYELIARGEILGSRYFLVVFSGLGFPSSLRSKQFIYEANSSERIIGFTDRLQKHHPSAQFVTHGDHDDLEGQYIQVTAVLPHRDLDHALYQRSKVPLSTKEFLFAANPSRFAITARRHSPKTGVHDQWVEKSVYTTAEAFPTILRRSEVVMEETVPLSPLQTAVERTVRKASELALLEKRVKSGELTSLLTMMDAINVSVDPESSSSVAQYHEYSLKSSKDDVEEEAKPNPLETALQIALLDFASVLKHCLSTLARTPYKTEHHNYSIMFASTFERELAILAPPASSRLPKSLTSEPDFNVSPPTPKLDSPTINGAHSPPAVIEQNHTSAPPESPTRPSSRERIGAMLKHNRSKSDAREQKATNGHAFASSNGVNRLAIDDEHSLASSRPSTQEKRNGRLSWRGSNDGHGSPDKSLSRDDLEGRPVTAQSALTGKSSLPSTIKKGGSIRKRLSTMGLGRKPSRAPLAKNGHGTLEEE